MHMRFGILDLDSITGQAVRSSHLLSASLSSATSKIKINTRVLCEEVMDWTNIRSVLATSFTSGVFSRRLLVRKTIHFPQKVGLDIRLIYVVVFGFM